MKLTKSSYKAAGSQAVPETIHYKYDKQSNLLSDGTNVYSYDGFSRLSRAEMSGGRVQVNRYDAEGLRHEMEENGELVKFLFSGDKVVAEEEGNGNVIRYIRGLGIISSDSESARTYYHYVSDEQGSITHVLKGEEKEEAEELDRAASAGAEEAGSKVLNYYEYDAFGNTTVIRETVKNRFRYDGEQYDAVMGQYYLRARYYNPVIGRFTQEDTYYGDGLNLYAYCGNNPVGYEDPSGHQVCPTQYSVYKKFREQGMSKKEAYEAMKKELGIERKSGYKDSGTSPDFGKKNSIGSKIKSIQNKTPEQLIAEGWEDVTNPKMAIKTTSREFYDPKSGMKIRFDKGVEGASGFEAVDHYHIYNPNCTKKKIDLYYDIDGNPVGKGSKASHIVIQIGGN